MLQKEFTVIDRHGLHAQPATKIVKLASLYADVDVKLQYKDQVVSVLSILSVLSLGVPAGAHIFVQITGNAQVSQIVMDKIEELLTKERLVGVEYD